MSKQLVNVYVLTQENLWKLVFKDIPEDIAIKIWRAGFETGENRFSIDKI